MSIVPKQAKVAVPERLWVAGASDEGSEKPPSYALAIIPLR